MKEPVIGKPIDDAEAGRDAIHIAIAPCTASVRLAPGEPVALIGDGLAGPSKLPIGIVDPYLTAPVFNGERFWLFLMPKTITSLRHVWTHPSFAEPTANDGAPSAISPTSEVWIRNFAEEVGLSYSALMDGAEEWLRDGEYLNRGGLLEGEVVPGEFWDHFERVTGTTVGSDRRQSFFTCSC